MHFHPNAHLTNNCSWVFFSLSLVLKKIAECTLCPLAGSWWCDGHGSVPKGSVSSCSALLILQDGSHFDGCFACHSICSGIISLDCMYHYGGICNTRGFLISYILHHECFSVHWFTLFCVSSVRGWRDVNLHYCERLQTPFITGRPSLSADLEAVLPMAVDESLSHQQMQSLFSSLCTEDQKFSR